MVDALQNAGRNEDIAFNFDAIARTPNTLDSHRLIRWAGGAGLQNEVVERLFTAYFEDGRDIGNRDVLVEIASDVGMDSALVADLLDQGEDRELIEREDALAHRMGISGVPTFIFENKYLVSGAQDAETLAQVMDKVAEKLADEQENKTEET
jgi:predicted DsbA family dithiol-disulfide isomerase